MTDGDQSASEMWKEFGALFALVFLISGALLSWGILGVWLEGAGVGLGTWMLAVLPEVKWAVIVIGSLGTIFLAIAADRGVFADGE